MSIIFRAALVAALGGLPLLSAGQTTAPAQWPAQGQLVREGVALYDKQDYAGAIAKYEAVTPGDTAYALAQNELALSLLAAGKNAEAVAAAQRALPLNPFEPQTYNVLANAQENLKQVDAALATYQKGLKLFPYNQNLRFNYAVTLRQQANPAPAMLAALAHALELRPAHPGTHRALGTLAAQQGQLSHALMSWLVFLALRGEKPGAQAVLVDCERLAQGVATATAEEKLPSVTPNAAFAELDQLLESKVALQKEYVTKVKFTAAVVKQTQLLIEKFPVDGPADDFWVRVYGPLVKALRQGDNLTTFTYLTLQAADDDKGRQWVKANRSKVDKMVATVFVPFIELREQQLVVGGKAGQRERAWFNEGGLLAGLGPGTLAAGKFTGTGDWTGVAESGAVESTGRFSPTGQRMGTWKILRPDGSIEKTFAYDAKGERDGLAQEFYPSGQTSADVNYRAGKVDGAVTLYNECGTRTATRTLKDDKLEGVYTTYHPNGQVEYRATLRADKINGLEEKFYADGSLEHSVPFVDGLRQGAYKLYRDDKSVEKEASYDHDELHGEYIEHWANGAVSETGRYEHDKRTGLWREYFPTGKLSVEKTYDPAGELHGTYRDYDGQGRLYATTEYVHGHTTRLQYLDPAGKVLLDEPVKKSRTAVRTLSPDGLLAATGSFVDGQMNGEWKWVHRDGTLREIDHYDAKGRRTGVSEYYFPGGQLRQRMNFDANGEEDGYFEQYFADGVLSQTGYFRAGKRHGPWKHYYATGKMSEEFEYHNGDQNGPARSYAPGGKLTQVLTYEYGKLRHITTHDSTGQLLSDVALALTTKEYTLNYPGGKPRFKTGTNCFALSGPATSLRPDGSVAVRFTQVDGRYEGPYESFGPDGKPESKGAFHAGQASGEWTEYHPNGQLNRKGHYNAAGADGEWTYYFPNGKVAFVETYVNGEVHGIMRRYNPAGELLIEKRYEQGRLRGYRGPGAADAPWQLLPAEGGKITTAFANGKPALEENYLHDQLAGASTYYYSSGTVFRRSTFSHGLRTGLLESFSSDGKPMERENYLHGELHGRCRYFRPDGTPERELSYLAGERSGPATYFDASGKPTRTETYWNAFVYGK